MQVQSTDHYDIEFSNELTDITKLIVVSIVLIEQFGLRIMTIITITQLK